MDGGAAYLGVTWYVQRKMPTNNACIYYIAQTRNGPRLLLLKHARSHAYGPPGGKCNRKESEWKCVRREYQEEVGHEIPSQRDCLKSLQFDVVHRDGSHTRCFVHWTRRLPEEGVPPQRGGAGTGEIECIQHFSLADLRLMVAGQSGCRLRDCVVRSMETVVAILEEGH